MSERDHDIPISPLKKMKILSEKQNVQVKPLPQIVEAQKPIVTKPVEPTPTPVVAPTTTTEQTEPLLQESAGQYVIFPINHQDIWHMYKSLVDNFWSPPETIQQLESLELEYDEGTFMRNFSSIYASPDSEGFVIENFAEKFTQIIQVTEAKFFYGHQLMVQNIHYELFNRFLDKFAPTPIEKTKLFKIVEAYEPVQNKRNWISSWSNCSFGEQLLASACLHGLFFVSIELIQNWLQTRTRKSNSHELIDMFERLRIDQDLARDFACLMMSHLKSKPTTQKVVDTINQAAKLEFDFLLNALRTELIGVDPNELIMLIDKKAKLLKTKILNITEEKKQASSNIENVNKEQSSSAQSKENYKQIVFDEDF